MTTTITTPYQGSAFSKTALTVALLALVLALASLVASAAHLVTSSSETSTVVATAPVAMADPSVKVRDGAVLPWEIPNRGAPTVSVPMSTLEFQDLPAGHLMPGPMA